MFDPAKVKGEKAAKAAIKRALADLTLWSNLLVPASLQEGLIVDVKEVQCGDPSCAPIDTVFTFVWQSGGRGMFTVPFSSQEIATQDDLLQLFPDVETLSAWHSGKRALWPRRPELRFGVGARVSCRVGPHPVKGWAPGRIVRLHYTEPSWPPNMVAPYQIALQDGRLIFAPQDTDKVIKLRPPPAPDAPSSPDYPDFDDNDDEDIDWEANDEEDDVVDMEDATGDESR